MKTLLILLAMVGVAVGWHYLRDDRAATLPALTVGTDAPPHRLSSDNVFYLLAYVSVPTARGPVGWMPGQRVRLAAPAAPVAGKIVVTDGTNVAALDPDVLTHDMDVAEALQKGDQQDQVAMAIQAAEARASLARQQLAVQVEAARETELASARQSAANTVGNSASRLNDAASYHGTAAYYSETVVYVNSPRRAAPAAADVGTGYASGAVATRPAAVGVGPATANLRTTVPRPHTPAMSSLPTRPGMNSGSRYGVGYEGQ